MKALTKIRKGIVGNFESEKWGFGSCKVHTFKICCLPQKWEIQYFGIFWGGLKQCFIDRWPPIVEARVPQKAEGTPRWVLHVSADQCV
jgi:hypothetical protein